MPVQLGAKPLADFSEPIAMLSDCHRRIEHFLDVLIRLTETIRGGPLDADSEAALTTALDYFHSAAPRHTEDEEHSLFPRLRDAADPRVQKAIEQIDALESDHDIARQQHDRVEAIGRRWLSAGTLDGAEVRELRGLLSDLRDRYERHIQLEDTEVFELAKAVLPSHAIREIGEEMADRRAARPTGTAFPDAPPAARPA